MKPVRFRSIHARAAKRKGGEKALAKLLGPAPAKQALLKLTDDRVLAEMARRVFCAGFVWQVIDAKWKGFEAAFLGFSPARLLHQPDDFWEKLASDSRIVRNGQKIMSVRANALFIRDIAAEHGSFGKFLSRWPAEDQVGLLELLKKRGSRLGGMTGQYLLRYLGWDGFVTSRDVVACLRDAGLELADMPSTRKDLAKVQAQFNAWAEESGLPRSRISRICALSIGENYDPAVLKQRMRGED